MGWVWVGVEKEVICCVPSLFELQKGCWLLRLPPLLVDPWPATPLTSGMHTKIRTPHGSDMQRHIWICR